MEKSYRIKKWQTRNGAGKILTRYTVEVRIDGLFRERWEPHRIPVGYRHRRSATFNKLQPARDLVKSLQTPLAEPEYIYP